MKFTVVHAITSSLLLALASSLEDKTNADVVMWASSGGGWRAMISNMGFANAFSRVGLISKDHCDFDLVSSNSGGSWFMIQFFYSSAFFDRILVDDPDQLRDFVLEWMGAYREFQPERSNDARCSSLKTLGAVIPQLSLLAEYCDLLAPMDYDYALTIQGMLNATSAVYGDPDFVSRIVNAGNRLPVFQNTDFYVQMGLAPNARSDNGNIVTLGPNQNPSQVYSVPLPMQYAVQKDASFFNYAVDDKDLPFVSTTFAAPTSYNSTDWEDYFRYPPPESASVLTTITKLTNRSTTTSFFRKPFGGMDPTVAQLAGSASSVFATYSASDPSIFSQQGSIADVMLQRANVTAIERAIAIQLVQSAYQSIYETPIFEGCAVCTQWPEPCGDMDGRIIDGGFVDGPNLAQTIGQYQNGGDLSKTLKIILTNHNYYADENSRFLGYFSTSFNEGIAPGDFIWPPGLSAGLGETNPSRSKQIFMEFLDDASMLDAFVPIPGTNLTSAVYKVTTVENPVFQVKSGQDVEILLLQINSNIPTYVTNKNNTALLTPLFGDLVKTIAQSDVLLERISAFLDSPSMAPTASSVTTTLTPTSGTGGGQIYCLLGLFASLIVTTWCSA
jgi:hypothetical protein